MIDDENLLMISSLQHFMFCKRRFALVHIENVWADNYFTASGTVLHEHVDEHGHETRRDLHTATAVRLVSHRLGLTGIADMLEFHRTDSEYDGSVRVAASMPRLPGFWHPFPIEYKRGKSKGQIEYAVQLCAQALCLEEMLGVSIPAGALYFGANKRREEIAFDDSLRTLTINAINEARKLMVSGITPPAEYTKACESCSIIDLCQPQTVSRKSARRWIESRIAEALA